MDPTKPRPWVPNVVLDTRQDPESRQAATAATAQPRPLQPRPSLAVQQNQADMEAMFNRAVLHNTIFANQPAG